MQITITDSAKNYLSSIISSLTKANRSTKVSLRIIALMAGTPKATIELAYCFSGEEKTSDLAINYEKFILYVDKNSEQALQNAIIDYRADHLSKESKLHINAPFLKESGNNLDGKDPSYETNLFSKEHTIVKNSEERTIIKNLFDQITEFLAQEVNNILLKHHGSVKLIKLNHLSAGFEVELEFDGGCKGCSMINFTLKQNVEKSLKNRFYEIKSIKDVTDHSTGKVPYY